MATIANRGTTTMPATFGFHPAFRWPLPDAGEQGRHALDFAVEEQGPLRRIDAAGLLEAAPHLTPIDGRRLMLSDDFFTTDALIFEAPASRSLRYGGEGGPALAIEWTGLPHLGVWTKPGAPYVCIEPWHDLPAGPDAPRALIDRDGFLKLRPGETHEASMAIRVS